jgi:predicted LPLAT superfamily acyltransferase
MSLPLHKPARAKAAAGTRAKAAAGTSATAAVGTSEWAERSEQGHLLALRLMAWIAVTLGRPMARWLLHPIALYYLCFASAARRHSKRYLGRALGRPASTLDVYKHMHCFASTVLDRVYFVRGHLNAFDVKITDGERLYETLNEGRGVYLLGAHIGSFEALQAVGAHQPGWRVAMVMYPDNAKKIHGVLKALAPQFEMGIIPIGSPGSTLAIRDWLDANGLVGLLGDRQLASDTPRAAHKTTADAMLPFLGVPTRFSDGPLRLAAMLRRRVIFMASLYRGGRQYDVCFETLADFSAPTIDTTERERLIQQALRDYVARLEALVREAPYNWFNFFDYWCEDVPAPAQP